MFLSDYSNPIQTDSRSPMSAHCLRDETRTSGPSGRCRNAGLLNLQGHRSGRRHAASIYNAVPEAAIDRLLTI